MAFDLSSIKTGAAFAPPRAVIYGPHGIGKTSTAAGAPAPIGLLTEDGLGILDVPHFPLIETYDQAVEAIGALVTQDHDYKTVFVDSLDHLEPLIWDKVATDHGRDHIEDIGYGKGYTYALSYWREFLDGMNALRAKGMAVILLAHNEVKRYDSPETDPYDRHQIKLHRTAAAVIEEWADMVLFANWQTSVAKTEVGFNKEVSRGITTGARLLHTTEKPAYKAKNRYSLPDTIPLSWEAIAGALANAIKTTTKKEAA